MNSSPDNNKNSYTDYSLNGVNRQSFSSSRQGSQQTRRTQSAANAQPRPAQQYQQNTRELQRREHPSPQVSQQTQQRRPLNDEERRRLEAARMAAMQNGGRMTEDEIRRRRQEQQYLNSAQPEVNTRRRVEIQNPTGQSRTPVQQRRRKNKIRINAGAVIFVLLIAGVIGVSAYQINKDDELPEKKDENISSLENIGEAEIIDVPNAGADETDDASVETEDPAVVPGETEPPAEEQPNFTLYDTVTVSNGTMDEGNLILVNYKHAYADTDTVALANVYSQRQSGVKVSGTAVSVTADTLAAIDNMLFGLTNDTGCNDLLINSGYRNIADQQKIYDNYVINYGAEYAQSYVADAGHSEHHTGLACDLSFFTDDGYLIPIAEHEYGWWLSENCDDYGFILRYPSEKVDITKIAYEAWHFRYVGVPHAYACNAFGYCFEEYIDALRGYTADTKLLHIKADGSVADAELASLPVEGGGWLTYYVPADEGENTEVKLLRGDMYADYEISGNNADGYIVTITLP